MNSSVRRWPLPLIGATTAVAVWSGWVGLGQRLASIRRLLTRSCLGVVALMLVGVQPASLGARPSAAGPLMTGVLLDAGLPTARQR